MLGQTKTTHLQKNWIFQISALYSEWYPNKITAAECWDIEHSRRCTLPADDFKYDKKLKCKPEGCSIWNIPEPNSVLDKKTFYKAMIVGLDQ